MAGNGLLTRTKSGQGITKETLLTSRLHRPTLQMGMVFSLMNPAHTPPKSVEPVTRTSPEGTLPETETMRLGETGSVLPTTIVADLGPKAPLGWKRIGTATESPGWMTNGKFTTAGTMN